MVNGISSFSELLWWFLVELPLQYIERFPSDPIEQGFDLLLWCGMVGGILAAAWLALRWISFVADTVFVPEDSARGRVLRSWSVHRWHASPEPLTEDYPIGDPVRVVVAIEAAGTSAEFELKPDPTNPWKVGQPVLVAYRIGRFSKRIHLMRFAPWSDGPS
jgi:hypothetical protein